jgi:hypothetical protein
MSCYSGRSNGHMWSNDIDIPEACSSTRISAYPVIIAGELLLAVISVI